jgi:hypothetical protein
MGKTGDKKVVAPSWVSRGLHSESGGGRGLTARDAVCVESILAISGLLVYYFLKLFSRFFAFFAFR